MSMLPYIVVLSKADVKLVSELLVKEKDALAYNRNEFHTVEFLEDKTNRLRQLVSVMRALNDAARTTYEYSQELKAEGE